MLKLPWIEAAVAMFDRGGPEDFDEDSKTQERKQVL